MCVNNNTKRECIQKDGIHQSKRQSKVQIETTRKGAHPTRNGSLIYYSPSLAEKKRRYKLHSYTCPAKGNCDTHSVGHVFFVVQNRKCASNVLSSYAVTRAASRFTANSNSSAVKGSGFVGAGRRPMLSTLSFCLGGGRATFGRRRPFFSNNSGLRSARNPSLL